MENITTKSINQIIRNLKGVKKRSSNIDHWFFRYSLTWIKKRANELLDDRINDDYPHPTTIARQWTIKYYDFNAILENDDPNSGAIEFGVGIVGETEKNPQAVNDPRVPASEQLEEQYDYNRSSPYKDENGAWTFKLDDKTYIFNFRGYTGKSFLYDAFMEYINKEMYNEFFTKAVDKVMKGKWLQK